MSLYTASVGADIGIVLAVIILLGLTAMLALAETGLVRTSKSRARALAEQGHRGAKSLVRLVENPDHFLTPLLLMVLICQLVLAAIVDVEAAHIFGALGVVIATVFEVVVIFVFAEAIPKQWAVRNADRASLFSAPIIGVIVGFPPIRLIAMALIKLSQFLTKEGHEQQSEVTESELLALADFAAEEDVIEDEERALISSIIEFGDTIVREVMAPRPDVVAIDHEVPADAALERAMEAGLSRIPIYAGSLDHIVGVAYARDLVHTLRNNEGSRPVGELCRKAHFVPETKRVAPLLREMQREQFHMAVAIDEYGGTAGIVTLEDLIEELVGDISDEFDIHEPLVTPIGDGEFRVSGKMPVDEVNDLLGAKLPVGDWDTVAGLVFHLRGQVPTEGETIATAGHILIPEHVQRRRIGSVRIIQLPTPDDEDEEE